jgi:hypothetical protein
MVASSVDSTMENGLNDGSVDVAAFLTLVFFFLLQLDFADGVRKHSLRQST